MAKFLIRQEKNQNGIILDANAVFPKGVIRWVGHNKEHNCTSITLGFKPAHMAYDPSGDLWVSEQVLRYDAGWIILK
jgi:hypothetical protein